MGRPAIPGRIAVLIKLPASELERVDALAARNGDDRTATIRALILQSLDAPEPEAPTAPAKPRQPVAPKIPAAVKGVAIKSARDLVTVKAEPAFKSRLKGQWAPAKGKPGGKSR